MRRVHQLDRDQRPPDLHPDGPGRSRVSCPATACTRAGSSPRPAGASPGSPVHGRSTCPAATWSPCGSSSPATASTPTGGRSTSPATTWGPTRRPASGPCGSIPLKGYVTEHAGDAVLRPDRGRADRRPAPDRPGPRPREPDHRGREPPVLDAGVGPGPAPQAVPGRQGLQDRGPGGQPPAGPGDRTGQPGRSGSGQERGTRALDLLGLRCRQVALCRPSRRSPSS